MKVSYYQLEWMGVGWPPNLPRPNANVKVESQIDTLSLVLYRILTLLNLTKMSFYQLEWMDGSRLAP